MDLGPLKPLISSKYVNTCAIMTIGDHHCSSDNTMKSGSSKHVVCIRFRSGAIESAYHCTVACLELRLYPVSSTWTFL